MEVGRTRHALGIAASAAAGSLANFGTMTKPLHAGGGALRLDQPFQRFWRDTHAAMNHINNTAEPVYEAWSLNTFGLPVPDGIKY